MSTPNPLLPAGSSIPVVPPPKCPHCKAEMPDVQTYSYQAGPAFLILTVHCSTCRTLLHMGIMPVARTQQPGEGELPEPKSNLWKPS